MTNIDARGFFLGLMDEGFFWIIAAGILFAAVGIWKLASGIRNDNAVDKGVGIAGIAASALLIGGIVFIRVFLISQMGG
jgi:hypothetical protein